MTSLLVAAVLAAGAPAGPDYVRDVKPLLGAKCYACHGAVRQKAGLRLDAGQLVLQGTKRGPVVVPGKPDESPLIEAVLGHDRPRMPPEGEGEHLSQKEVALLRDWIAAGAKAPDEPVPADPKAHWAYQPPRRPSVPVLSTEYRVLGTRWSVPVTHPVDAFLAAERAKHGLTNNPEADRPTLLRRVTVDLTGVPPTPAELHAFLSDASPDAYEKAVDRLLASPMYGERWGRHWMDVWRYSDPFGLGEEYRYSQRHVWRWRDWIVESLNADKGYDRMVVEMLAGDEVAPADRDTLRATGYLARNWYKFNRNVWLQDTVEHAATGFLGVTLRCARCHDHKYDPVSQQDYYRFRAFFEPHDVRIDPLPGRPDTNKDGVARAFDGKPDEPTYLFVRGDERTPDKSRSLTPGVPGALGGDVTVSPVKFSPRDFAAVLPTVAAEARKAARAELDAAEVAAKHGTEAAKVARQWWETVGPVRSPLLASALALVKAEAGKQCQKAEATATQASARVETARAALAVVEARFAADTVRLNEPAAEAKWKPLAVAAGKAERKAAALKAAEAVLAAEHATPPDAKKLAAAKKAHADAVAAASKDGPAYTPLAKIDPAASTGRRLALAKWITDAKNPLTARVAVNHVWMRHFGTPLVPTVANFGLNGKPPTHPELLDWLAVEFVEPTWRTGSVSDRVGHSVAHAPGLPKPWSMKHLHRLIVTSRAYRLGSQNADGPNKAADPEDRWYWRANPRRMEAEAVRDSLLAVAGQLDRTMGGPILDEKLGQTSRRRSLYFRFNTEYKMPFLDQFDAASPTECYERRESVVPQQALALHNSVLALNAARELAKTLAPAAPRASEFVAAAFEHVLCRAPTAGERARCEAFLREQADLYRRPAKLTAFPAGPAGVTPPAADPDRRAREDLVHVLFNHNDFVTVR